jgi:hypothetical protein
VVALVGRRPRPDRGRALPDAGRASRQPGGYEAVQLRVAEQYIGEFGKLARTGNSMIIPANLSDVGSMIATAMTAIKQQEPTANGRAGDGR